VTNIYQGFTYKMAAKINWHRYGTIITSLTPYVFPPRTQLGARTAHPRLDLRREARRIRRSGNELDKWRRGMVKQHRAGFKCVEALGRIVIRGPYPPSNAIIYMHLQL